MNHLQVGEVDDRVAARVAAAEPVRAHFLAAEPDRRLVGERDARQANRRARRVFEVRRAVRHQVGARVLVGDDLGNRQHQRVAAGVVVVLMRVDDVAQGLARQRLHLREDVVVIPVEHVVDENHALARHVERDIAAVARHHVEVVFDFLSLQRPRRSLRLRVHNPGGLKDCDRDDEAKNRGS